MRSDGSGSLVFDAHANLAGQVRSRWLPTGAGRADVEAHGGDADFERVYASATTPDGGVGTEGEASACVFTEPLR